MGIGPLRAGDRIVIPAGGLTLGSSEIRGVHAYRRNGYDEICEVVKATCPDDVASRVAPANASEFVAELDDLLDDVRTDPCLDNLLTLLTAVYHWTESVWVEEKEGTPVQDGHEE